MPTEARDTGLRAITNMPLVAQAIPPEASKPARRRSGGSNAKLDGREFKQGWRYDHRISVLRNR